MENVSNQGIFAVATKFSEWFKSEIMSILHSESNKSNLIHPYGFHLLLQLSVFTEVTFFVCTTKQTYYI